MNRFKAAGLILIILFSAQALRAYMRDEGDRVISSALIEKFRQECTHKATLDQSKIIDLQTMFTRVREDKSPEGTAASVCYQERMSQLVGIHQLFKELCDEVTAADFAKKPEDDQLRLLVMTQRYRRGVTTFHDLLNDCLVERSSKKFVVGTSQYRLEAAGLRRELEDLKISRPFEPNRVDFK